MVWKENILLSDQIQNTKHITFVKTDTENLKIVRKWFPAPFLPLLVKIRGCTATNFPLPKDIFRGPFWVILQNFRPPGSSVDNLAKLAGFFRHIFAASPCTKFLNFGRFVVLFLAHFFDFFAVGRSWGGGESLYPPHFCTKGENDSSSAVSQHKKKLSKAYQLRKFYKNWTKN